VASSGRRSIHVTLPYVNHVDDLTRISSVSKTSGTDDQIGHRSEVYDR